MLAAHAAAATGSLAAFEAACGPIRERFAGIAADLGGKWPGLGEWRVRGTKLRTSCCIEGMGSITNGSGDHMSHTNKTVEHVWPNGVTPACGLESY